MLCVVGFAAVRATEMKTGHTGTQKNSCESIFFKWANEPVAKRMDECTGKVAESGEGSHSSVIYSLFINSFVAFGTYLEDSGGHWVSSVTLQFIFFLNLKRFICFAFVHVCSDYMYVPVAGGGEKRLLI